jgi:hypothetical protein
MFSPLIVRELSVDRSGQKVDRRWTEGNENLGIWDFHRKITFERE